MASTSKEIIDASKALQQWMISQDIPRSKWAPICMMVASQDVWRVATGDPSTTLVGQMLLVEMMNQWTHEDLLNG